MKVLVVDNDPVISDIIAFALSREGFQVMQAQDGITALQCWAAENPDLVVLEVDLPLLDGFTVCQRIRKENKTPVVFLTSRAGEEDILRGLELGADVYMTKPFSPRQLVARVRAILRRTLVASDRKAFQSGIPVYTKRMKHPFGSQKPISLAPLEKRLLGYLLLNAGQVLPYESIISHVWGVGCGDRDMLRHLIRRLRTKIELDPSNPTLLKTIPGLGYALEEHQEPV
jgi:DNA-binding response OmpR family regulator